MSARRVVFRVHTIQRMARRHVSISDVRQVLENGERIDEYPDDKPFPSALVLGWCDSRPLHVVVADNFDDNEAIVVTV
ncbi:MAG: DUF4258 domain-containing protein [Myxococcota bacterium]